jgi:hypothetical protein
MRLSVRARLWFLSAVAGAARGGPNNCFVFLMVLMIMRPTYVKSRLLCDEGLVVCGGRVTLLTRRKSGGSRLPCYGLCSMICVIIIQATDTAQLGLEPKRQRTGARARARVVLQRVPNALSKTNPLGFVLLTRFILLKVYNTIK